MDWLALLGDYLFVFVARLTDVSLSTIRFMMMVRGKRLAASVLGLFEILVWIIALGRVLQGLDNPIKIALYSLGFASGIYVGQYLEEKMAVGVTSLQIIPHRQEATGEMVAALRAMGSGVTVLTGEGRSGPRQVLLVTVQRKSLKTVLKETRQHDPDAFITVLDTRLALGGTLTYRK